MLMWLADAVVRCELTESTMHMHGWSGLASLQGSEQGTYVNVALKLGKRILT